MTERKSPTRKVAAKKAEPPAPEETPAAPSTLVQGMDDLKAAAEEVTETPKKKGSKG